VRLVRAAWILVMGGMLNSQAQTPTPAQTQAQSAPSASSGPTVEQTITFINDAFDKQGNFYAQVDSGPVLLASQKVTLESPCILVYVATQSSPDRQGVNQTQHHSIRVSLDDDPRGVTVEKLNNWYSIQVDEPVVNSDGTHHKEVKYLERIS
jgi:hypothetical protein